MNFRKTPGKHTALSQDTNTNYCQCQSFWCLVMKVCVSRRAPIFPLNSSQTHTHSHPRAHTHMHTQRHTHIRIHIHTHTHTHTHPHTHTHTHTHDTGSLL